MHSLQEYPFVDANFLYVIIFWAVSPMDKKPTPQSLQQHVIRASLLSGLGLGCVIIVILAAAVGLGLWLDATFPTGRRVYTLGLILVSVPITFFVIFYFGRWLSARMAPPKSEDDPEQENSLEDVDRGTN